MVLLQKLPPNLSRFGKVSDCIFKKMNMSSCEIFVTDYYREDSVKSLEHARRPEVGSIRVTALRKDQKKPIQCKKYLQDADNKTELVLLIWNIPLD